VFDFDIFPEDSYDPSSGEFSGDFDFEPIQIGQVTLDDAATIYARVFTISEAAEADKTLQALQYYADKGFFDRSFNPLNPSFYPTPPLGLVGARDSHVRGPFIGDYAIQRFLDDTGLRHVAQVYYDDEFDEFWVDIETDPAR